MTQHTQEMPIETRYSVLIVGGGTAGIACAALILKLQPHLDVAVIEPSKIHAYQPGWTLVGSGVMKLNETLKPQASVIPKNCAWIKSSVTSFSPKENFVTLEDGRQLYYKKLIVCPGIQLNWNHIDGLEETLGRNGVCSNYSAQTVDYTWTSIQSLKHGKAIFTQPPKPIKCAGAPQKIAYLASDYWRKHKLSSAINVDLFMAGDAIFSAPFYRPSLLKMIEHYGINLSYKHNLIAVNGQKKEAVFNVTNAKGEQSKQTYHFDMLHVTPPQSAPDFVRKSTLVNENGWLDVSPQTLQHNRYPDIFGIGDVVGTSNSKTMAAARAQLPVVVTNLLDALNNQSLSKTYDGYGACPLTVAYGKVVLAEFLYGGKPAPSFPYDERKPSRFAWFLKTRVFPFLYWHMMLKGDDITVPHHPEWVPD